MPKTNRPPMVLLPCRFSPAAVARIEGKASAEEASESEIIRRAVWFYFDYLDRGVHAALDTSGIQAGGSTDSS